jgi:hypothetical protein
MSNNLYYFDGTGWQPISSGGGGGVGPQGPAGESVTVYVQTTTPVNPRVGDHWINEAAVRTVTQTTYKTLDDIGFKTLDDLKTYPTLDDI